METKNLPEHDITEREIEIIKLLAEGLTNSKIADRLYLSRNTIKWYIQQLNQKLHTDGRNEIVKEANRLGILDLPANSAFSGIRTNLPHQTTPFIGRASELVQLHRILSDSQTRLLTILAPGGMGKTRIGLELAEQQLNHYSDGVYFVPLQAVDNERAIVTHIAQSIGFQPSAKSHNIKQQLLNFLSRKSMLILFDNFEQVIDGAELINEILLAAPGITFIVTSREKLNLLGEAVYLLQGMVHPGSDRRDEITQYDAVQLIRQAARRIMPDWDITPKNIHAVTRLCDLTQGMPLGIILAISWLGVYTLDRICDEIQKSADILTTTMRDLPRRQRSIRAVYEYSWERLSVAERDAMVMLSIFRGGCTLEAVEAITNATPIVLQGLMTKALITRTHNSRYEVHELLRQYAEEQFFRSDHRDDIRLAHAQYYANVVYLIEAQLKDHRQLNAILAIERDMENIYAAWNWAVQHQRVDVLNKMLESLRLFSLLTNRIDGYSGWLFDAIEHLTILEKHEILTKLHIYYADTLIEQSLSEKALQIVKQYEAKLLDLDDVSVKALGLAVLSRTSYILGNANASLEYAKTYLEIALHMHDRWHQAQAHYALCLIMGLWDSQTPLKHIEESLELSMQTGDRYWLTEGYILGGLTLLRLGRVVEAKIYTKKASVLAEKLGTKSSIITAYGNLSTFARRDGDWVCSEQFQREALSLADELGYSHEHATALIKLSELRLIQGDSNDAEQYLETAESLLNAIEYPAALSGYYTQKSANAEYRGQYELALQSAMKAVEYIKTNMNWSMVHNATQRLAWALSCTDAYEQVQAYLVRVTRQELQSQSQWGMIRNVALLSLFKGAQGEFEQATEMLGLVDQHRIQSAWLQQHPKLLTLREILKNKLGELPYQSAWSRGSQSNVYLLADWLSQVDNA